jgi:TolB-like protein/Flp pilus assembly protein TadD
VTAPEKSIAVLPFENLTAEKANAYFADGIQDEILTRLSNIADLKVISRTSTRQYQSKPANLREIAKQLGVATILEGSVQKVANQVRVNVQLINAQSDSHLWADTYDRNLTDIFGVESDIAKRVAESLQAKLTGREEQALAFRPTNNPEAYDAYLRGLAIEARSPNLEFSAVMSKAGDSYERAVQVDPNFAVAWARLSRVNSLLYFGHPAETARRDTAKKALENAQKLTPNSPETLLSLGYYQYRVVGDYRAAEATFTRVGELLPGSSDAPSALGLVTRREGHWDQSVAYFEQALALDPRNEEVVMDAAWTYSILRQFVTALKLYDRALDITPNNPGTMAEKAAIYQAQGNLQGAARLLSQISSDNPSALPAKIDQLRLERNYGEAIRLMQASENRFVSWQVWLALFQRLNGDVAAAHGTAEAARKTFDQLYKDEPNSVPAADAAALSLANAVMGQKDLALKQAEGAIMLYPSAKDAVNGPALEENLALVETIVGEKRPAISTLTQLLQTPYRTFVYSAAPITAALLRLDPIWDPLRGDPAFQKLCEEKQP